MEKRNWYPEFYQYMDEIVGHPNYQGLPITKKADGTWGWITTKKARIGQARMAWCEAKARELGFEVKPGVYAKVMREIHPTKWKVCQICGRKLSIYYHYPTANTLKALRRQFHISYEETDHISDIWEDLLQREFTHAEIAVFWIQRGGLRLSPSAAKDDIIQALERLCREEGKRILSPGAMADFPDRFDGFHSYNLCCRALEDTGRSEENLRRYTKDRRAYECWSDGNIRAANQFMKSDYFRGTTADHIGPISLGFVHDPCYLRPLSGSENSALRDRLTVDDIGRILQIQARTGVYPMSWYGRLLWEHIRSRYLQFPALTETAYRDALRQNRSNFMFALWYVMETCGDPGENFLEAAFLRPHYDCFSYDYQFNDQGDITGTLPRHFTERSQYEIQRYRRVALAAAYEYQEKENRHINPDLTGTERKQLDDICRRIMRGDDFGDLRAAFIFWFEQTEQRLVRHLEQAEAN